MDYRSELEKRLGKNTTSSSYRDESGKSKSQISTMRANEKNAGHEDLLNRLNRAADGIGTVDADYISKYISDSQKYFADAKKNDGILTFDTAGGISSSVKNARDDLMKRGSAISDYLYRNRDAIDQDAYGALMNYIDGFAGSSYDAADYFSRRAEDAGRYGNADEYNASIWKSKYADYDYGQLRDAIGRTTGDEREWLKVYSAEKKYGTLDEYDRAIADLEESINEIKAGISAKNAENVGTFASGAWKKNREADRSANAEAEAEIRDDEERLAALKRNRTAADRLGKTAEAMAVTGNADFADVSANREFNNPTKDELFEIDRENSYTDYGGTQFLDAQGKLHDYSELPDYAASHTYEVPDKLGLFLDALQSGEDMYQGTPFADGRTDTWSAVMREGSDGRWQYLDDNEVAAYYYYLNKGDKDAAYKFLDDMQYQLGLRENEENQRAKASAGTLERILYNAASVPENVLGAIPAFVDDAVTMLKGEEIDPYAPSKRMMNYASNTREETAQRIQNSVKSEELGTLLSNSYQALMSGLDSVFGASSMGGAYTITMGMGAASQKAAELWENGAMRSQIAAGAIASGAIEWITEKFSYDKIVDLMKSSAGKSLLKQLMAGAAGALNEGVEEVNSDLLNLMTDAVINGYNSENNEKIRQYMIDYGLTEGEAKKRAAADTAVNTLWSFYGGFISGGMLGAAEGAANRVAGTVADYRAYDQAVREAGKTVADSGRISEIARIADSNGDEKLKMVAEALSSENTEEMTKLERRAYEKRVGKAYADAVKSERGAVMSAGENAVKSYIREQLAEKGVTEENEPKLDILVSGILHSTYTDSGKYTNAESDAVGAHASEAKAVMNTLLNNEELTRRTRDAQKKAVENYENAASLAEPKTETQKKYEVSDTGKTVMADTGDEVKVRRIAGKTGGDMTLELDDGTKVNASDVKFSSADEAIIYDSVAKMNVNPEAATQIVRAWNPAGSLSPEAYIAGIREGIIYGSMNQAEDYVSKYGFYADLSQEQKNVARTMGRLFSSENAAVRQSAVNKASGTNKGNASRKGTVHSDIDESTLAERQKQSMRGLRFFSENLGIDIYVYDSKAENTTANGWFDAKDNSIHIDVYSGQNYNGLMMFTLGHELTHFISQWSPEKYKVFSDYLINAYGERGVDVEELISRQIGKAAQNGRELSRDDAYEELVADACEQMLLDDSAYKAVAELKRKDAGLFEKIKAFINDFVAKIKAAYSGVAPETEEDRLMQEKLTDAADRLQKLWNEALTDAAEAYQAGNGNLSAEDMKVLSKHNLAAVDNVVVSGEMRTLMEKEGFRKPSDNSYYSYRSEPEWEKSVLAQYGDTDDTRRYIGAVKAFTDAMIANDAVKEYVPMGSYAYDSKGPLRSSEEYIVTFDMDTSCPRTFQFLNYRDELQRRAGRFLTYNESVNLLELMRAYGQQIPCSYCYVENKRVLLSASYNNFFKFRNDVLNEQNEEKAKKFMYGYNAKKGTLTKASADVFARWRSDMAYNPTVEEVWSATSSSHNTVLNYLDDLYSGNVIGTTGQTRTEQLVNEHFGITQTGARAEISNYVSEWIYDTMSGRKHRYDTQNVEGTDTVDERALSLHHEALAYAKSSSSAKSVENYTPYAGQLKNISEDVKNYVIGMGGIRKHSSNDFRIDYVQDYLMFFADLAAGGWTGHTYTKNPDYGRIFGRTGDRINMSIAFYGDRSDNLRMNEAEGANWNEVKELRKNYKNIGSMAMVTSDAQLTYALNADWIDMIIPFHASSLDKRVWYDLRNWLDYTSKQLERFYNSKEMTLALIQKALDDAGIEYSSDGMKRELLDAAKRRGAGADSKEAAKIIGHEISRLKKLMAKNGVAFNTKMTSAQVSEAYDNAFGIVKIYDENGKRVKPHFLPGDTVQGGNVVPGHHNDVNRYFELCRQYGVAPRFDGIAVENADGETVNVTEHDGYIKLLKETARTDSEQEKIKFNLDEYDEHLGMTPMQYAMKALEDFAKQGGYSNLKNDPYGIVDEFEREYLGKNREIGYLTERAKETREILDEMQQKANAPEGLPKYANQKAERESFEADGTNGDAVKLSDRVTSVEESGKVKNDLVENRFSLRSFEDGTRFVDVESDQEQFDNLDTVQKLNLATKIIREKYKGKVVGIDNPVYVNGKSANEYGHPAKFLSDYIADAKSRAATELDNLIDASTGERFEQDGASGHTHGNSTEGFVKYDTLFKVGDNYFLGVVNVEQISKGRLLKDITKIRDVTNDTVSSYGKNPKSYIVRDVSMRDYIPNSSKSQEENKLSDREPSSVDNRTALANALESSAKTDAERKRLADYKSKILLMNAEQEKLTGLRAQIRELSFAKGKRDVDRLKSLKADAAAVANRIGVYDSQLLRMEASEPLRNLVKQKRNEAYAKARKQYSEQLAQYRTETEQKNADMKMDYLSKQAKADLASDQKLFEAKEAMKQYRDEQEYVTWWLKKIDDQKRRDDLAQLENRLTDYYEGRISAMELKNAQKNFETKAKIKDIKDRQAYELWWLKKIESMKRHEDKMKRGSTVMRGKISKVVGELNNLLLSNTADRHVPVSMQGAVADVLGIINFDSVQAERRYNGYTDEFGVYHKGLLQQIDEAEDEATRNALIERAAKIQHADFKLREKLTNLKASYDNIREDQTTEYQFDQVISDMIGDVIDIVGDTPITDMSYGQLESVYNMYRAILKSVKNANKAFKEGRRETIEELGLNVAEEVRYVGGEKVRETKFGRFARKQWWNTLKPIYAMRMIGSDTFSDVFGSVLDAQGDWYRDMADAKEYRRAQAKKYNFKNWDFDKTFTFTASSGKKFDLSLEQIMSLYAYSKREQAADHIRKGGIVFDGSVEQTDKKNGVTVKYYMNTSSAYNISDKTLYEIIGKLTPEQRSYVDAMQDYLSAVMGAKGNEVSRKLYDVNLFGERNYFPLKSASQFKYEETQPVGEAQIKNSGFTKKVVKHASNPVVMSDFSKIWAEHVNKMSMYHAFVLPLEDFNRVWNFKTPASETEESVSVKSALQNAYGAGVNDYLKQLLTDLNGGARSQTGSDVINKLTGLFKKGAVMASASVTIQQPSAIARSMAYINPKYFATVKHLNVKRHAQEWEELKKYAPVAGIKEMGYFDTGMGQSSADWMNDEEYDGIREKTKAFFTDSAFRDDILTKAPELADEITWTHIWEAVKKETAAESDLKPGTEEFLLECGRRFSEVIELTQVYDSVLTRSGYMRSKDTGVKMDTAFMGEPTVTENMLADAALYRLRVGKSGDRFAASVVASVTASTVLNSLLKSIVMAYRDDKDDYREAYVSRVKGDIIYNMNPLTLLPFVKDVVSIFQGYDVSRSDMDLFSDLYRAINALDSSKKTLYEKTVGLIGAVSAFLGIPFKNLERDLRPIIGRIIKAVKE